MNLSDPLPPIKIAIIIFCFGFAFLLLSSPYINTPLEVLGAPQDVFPIEHHTKLYAIEKSWEYNVDFKEISKVIECESQWKPWAVNITDSPKGSWGLVQINRSAHDVTEEQALDPYYSINFIVKAFSEGKQSMWTCYNKI